ncbi:MAG: SGNH/GDSL hydrolase family protein [Clostridia bacterium]|nr:SGNH/GDSL hydrolase family protein [Clostridia bacterium]
MENILKEAINSKGKAKILIVGDSIGDGSCATKNNKWSYLVANKLKKKYACNNISLTNICVGGTDSLFGYHTLRKLSDRMVFDLVFVCHGENDKQETFPFYYEVLLRNIRLKQPGAAIVCILESSQRDYTPKIKAIQTLAEKYGCAVADTIKAFSESGKPYDMLSCDGVHVNDLGAKVYADEIYRVVNDSLISPKELPEPGDERVKDYDYYRFIPRQEMQYNLADYRLRTVAANIMVSYLQAPNAEGFTAWLDGAPVFEQSFKHNFNFVWERICCVNCENGEKTVTVTLADETDVNLLLGVIITAPTPDGILLEG